MADATNLVLVPGLLCTKALWAPQVAALGDVVAMTVADHTGHDSMAGIAKSILAAAPPRFALAGLSMGGYIAYEILRQASERVTKLALLNTGYRADAPQRREQRLALMALAEREGARRALETLLPMLTHKSRMADMALVEAVLQMGADTGTEAFKRQQTAIMSRPDSAPVLASIRCPTLLVVGREDALTPPQLAQEIASHIAEAKLEIVPDCGHLSTMEQPAAVNRALRAWLNG
jgi:pimeloyl-ACP methyl ester carboxylesterase